jgi:CheY-like chemotaxis protein
MAENPRQIVLVDDSATICALLQNTLVSKGFGPKEGYRPVIARDFETALELIEAGDVAAVVTDIFMPGIGGLAGIGIVKERWPDIPVIAMSGGTESASGANALISARRLGVDGYLEKPFDMNVLIETLRSAIAGREKLKVLVVDDSSTVRKFIRRMLPESGFVVREAGSVEEAFDQTDIVSMNLIVMDIFMPGEGGIAGILKLRQSWPEIPIIAVSGGWRDMGPDDTLAAALKIGADAGLRKPFDEETLKGMIAGLTAR